MHRTPKNVAQIMVRQDIRAHGKPRSRRHYAKLWNVPPSTAYYWIREAVAEAERAVEEAD